MSVIFKDIPDFPGYRVGDDGSIWSCLGRRGKGIGKGSAVIRTEDWKELKGGLDDDGYRKVILCASSKRRYVRVNRLVLEVFVGQREDVVAAHENGIKIDNRLSNLRWDKQVGNIADKKKHGTHQEGERHGGRLLDAVKVKEIRDKRLAGESLKSIASAFGVSLATVSAIARGRLWKCIA